MKICNKGNKLTIEYLISRGFVKEIIKAESSSGDDDEIMYIKNGITIYFDQYDSENPFSFATYVRGDGRFKSGFNIATDTQLDNLYFSLSNKCLFEVDSQDDIKQRIDEKKLMIESYKERKIRYPKDERTQDYCDIMISESQKELDELFLIIK